MEKYILQHSGEEIDTLLEKIEQAPNSIASQDYVQSEIDNLSEKIENIPENLATESFVQTKIAELVNSAPETLNTLGEIADAIEENETVVDALNAAIGNKANSSDVLTKTNTTAFTPTANYHPATKTYVDAKFVKGMIMMWSGNINSVPTGWALCNGSNGTPDLRNRFIVGAGSTYSIGNTGGSASVTLTTEQMPTHTHTATCATNGEHTHRYYTATNGHNRPDGGSGALAHTMSYYNTEEGGAHSHTVTIDSTGSGTAHENRPPYYALAFIMKL